MIEQRLAKAGGAIELGAVEHLANGVDAKSAVVGAPDTHRVEVFEREAIGSIILWQAAQTGLTRCSSRRWRTESSLAAWPVRLSEFSGSEGTLGGGGGGGVPSSTSITHLPRCTGDVRIAVEVSVKMLAWPSSP